MSNFARHNTNTVCYIYDFANRPPCGTILMLLQAVIPPKMEEKQQPREGQTVLVS